MKRFVIVDGLPYLLAGGKTYTCRWDETGFTPGAEVMLAAVPGHWHTELSILAQCAGHLDSITPTAKQAENGAERTAKPKASRKKPEGREKP